MDSAVLRRVLQGLSANAYGQTVTVLVQLISVPILLRAWGGQMYGEWLILFAIPAYLSMTDLGFSQSAGNDMTALVAKGDRARALAVFQSLAALVYTAAALGLVLSAVLLWHLPMREWPQFESMNGDTVRWVLLLLATEVFVRLPNGVTHAGLRASGADALHVGLDSTTRLLQFGAVGGAALSGGGPIAAASGFLAVRIFATPAAAFLLIRRYRWLHFGLAHARRHELRRLIKPALANVALPLAQALNIQGMVVVVGAVLGPLPVVVFSTLRTLTRLALQLVLAVSHAAEPEIAAAYGIGDRKLMNSIFLHALRAGLWLSLVAVGSLALAGRFIVDVWTDGQVAMEPVLFSWLLASSTATVLWYVALIALKAANRHLYATFTFVIASAASLALAALLLDWTRDLAAAGFALLLMDALMALYTLRTAARLLGVKSTTSLAESANPYPLLRGVFARLQTRS